MRAGEFDKRAEFMRRAPQASVAGNVRGGFETLCRRWVRFRPGAGARAVEAGQLADVGDARIWARPDQTTRSIGVGDRVVIEGRDYAVTHVPPAQRNADIEMTISSTMAG